MSDSVQMPALGESVTEGTVTRWLKQVGEHVDVDEPLLEVSTDKVDTEIPSPVAGVLQEILVSEDETVAVGTALAMIGDGATGGDGHGAASRRTPTAGGAPAEAARAPSRPPTGCRPSRPCPTPDVDAPPVRPSSTEVEEPAERPQPVGTAPGDGERVQMPALGESVTEGTVTRWLKHEGDTRRGRRAAARGLDRQGRHRDPVAGRGRVHRSSSGRTRPSPSAPTSSSVGARPGRAPPPRRRRPAEPARSAQAPRSPPQRTCAPPAPAPPAPPAARRPGGRPGPRRPPGRGGRRRGYRGAGAAPLSGRVSGPARPAGGGAPCARRSRRPRRPARQRRPAPSGRPGRRARPTSPRWCAGSPPSTASTCRRHRHRRRRPDPQAGRARRREGQAGRRRPQRRRRRRLRGPGRSRAAPRPSPPCAARPRRCRRLRRVIAQRMVESLQVSAQLTTVVEVDVTKIARLRDRAKRDFEAREGVKLSFLPFFALAAVEALKQYPVVNASIEGDADRLPRRGEPRHRRRHRARPARPGHPERRRPQHRRASPARSPTWPTAPGATRSRPTSSAAARSR